MDGKKVLIKFPITEKRRKQAIVNAQSSKRTIQLCLTIFMALCTYKIASDLILAGSSIMQKPGREKPVNSDSSVLASKPLLKILLYTSLFNRDIAHAEYVAHQRLFKPDHKLQQVINDQKLERRRKYEIVYKAHRQYLKRYIPRYDIVLFHVKDMPGSRLLNDVTNFRPSNQLWAYYNKESPFNTPNLANGKYDDLFNITITPKRDSDVFSPYGFYHRKKALNITTDDEHKINDVLKRILAHRIDRNKKNPNRFRLKQNDSLVDMKLDFKGKDLFIAWVVSNCNQVRDYYVQSLLPHLPIHIYGRCAKNYQQKRRCFKNDYFCEVLLRRYKFVLALENSFCDDYISDKYWNSIYRGNVPIVLGGSNYDETLVIPGSYINIRDFNSAESLSNYIIYLSQNEAEYDEYMRWKEHFVVDYLPNDHLRVAEVLKKLSELVKSPLKPFKSYDLSAFYGVKENCPLQFNLTKNW